MPYNAQGYIHIASDISTHNFMQLQSPNLDIVDKYREVLYRIKQDFNNYMPIQVRASNDKQENILY